MGKGGTSSQSQHSPRDVKRSTGRTVSNTVTATCAVRGDEGSVRDVNDSSLCCVPEPDMIFYVKCK